MAVIYDLYGGKNAPSDPNALLYMQTNPDVWNAYLNDASTQGLTEDANTFARTHYDKYGSKPSEGRIWGTPTTGGTTTGGTTTGGTVTGAGRGGDTISPFATLTNSLNSLTGQISSDTTKKDILAKLLAAIEAQSGNIDKGVQAAVDANNSTLRTGINDTANSTLQNLVNRRMMTGDVASDTMGSALGEVTRKAGAVNALATLEGMNKKAEIPALYSNALTGEANSSGSHIDSLMKPYQLLLNLLETDIYKYAQ